MCFINNHTDVRYFYCWASVCYFAMFWDMRGRVLDEWIFLPQHLHVLHTGLCIRLCGLIILVFLNMLLLIYIPLFQQVLLNAVLKWQVILGDGNTLGSYMSCFFSSQKKCTTSMGQKHSKILSASGRDTMFRVWVNCVIAGNMSHKANITTF